MSKDELLPGIRKLGEAMDAIKLLQSSMDAPPYELTGIHETLLEAVNEMSAAMQELMAEVEEVKITTSILTQVQPAYAGDQIKPIELN